MILRAGAGLLHTAAGHPAWTESGGGPTLTPPPGPGRHHCGRRPSHAHRLGRLPCVRPPAAQREAPCAQAVTAQQMTLMIGRIVGPK
jgi:hypothetical protein